MRRGRNQTLNPETETPNPVILTLYLACDKKQHEVNVSGIGMTSQHRQWGLPTGGL